MCHTQLEKQEFILQDRIYYIVKNSGRLKIALLSHHRCCMRSLPEMYCKWD